MSSNKLLKDDDEMIKHTCVCLLNRASASAAQGYELTAAGGAGGDAGATLTTAHTPHHPPMQQSSHVHHRDPRKRKNSH